MNKELREAVASRFWGKVDRRTETECWEWIAGKNSRGYGAFNVNGRTVRAHRFAYEFHNGGLASGVLVCHRCDNPSCCNPAHLFAGTYADNNRDKTEKGRNVRPTRDESAVRYKRGDQFPQAKLSDDQVLEIRKRSAAGEKNVPLAKFYGVHRTLIGQIVARKAWKHVP